MSFIYWTDSSSQELKRSEANGINTTTIFTGLDSPFDVIIDKENSVLYFTDNGLREIVQTDLDGFNDFIILDEDDYIDPFAPAAIGFHPSGSTTGVSGQIFFTDTDRGVVETKEIGVSGTIILASGLLNPRGIYVHSSGTYIYFTDADDGKVYRINRDGSNLTTLVDNAGYIPRGIVIHEVSEYIYWCDAGAEAILRSDLDGNNIIEIISNVLFTIDIDINLSISKIYWTDDDVQAVHRSNLDGTDQETLITGFIPFGLGLLQDEGLFFNNSLDLFIKAFEEPPISNSFYFEKIHVFAPTGFNAWEEFDLTTFGVPGASIAEIAIGNNSATSGFIGGIRQVGSVLERSISLDRPFGVDANNKDYCVMHVQADADSKIEIFAEASGIDFTLVGYWTSGAIYVEAFQEFQSNVSNDWKLQALAEFPILDLNNEIHIIAEGNIAEILLSQNNNAIDVTVGVRTYNSKNERKIRFQDTQQTGFRHFSTMFVEAGGFNDDILNSGEATIEVFTDAQAFGFFHLLGYWLIQPQQYNEYFLSIPRPSGDATWEIKELPRESGFDLIGSGIGEVLVANESPIYNSRIGIRESGSLQERLFDLPEVDTGTSNAARMHVNIDNGTTLVSGHSVGVFNEFASVDENFSYYFLGWWGQSSPINNINLFIHGGDSRVGKIYWIETSQIPDTSDFIGTIRKSNLDGTEIETLVTGLDNPKGITVVASIQKMYWTELVTIKRANLDGSSSEIIYNPASGIFGDIDFNTDDSKIYFTTRLPDYLQKIGLEIPEGETSDTRTDVENVITSGVTLFEGLGFDLNNDKVIFTDIVGQNIQRSNYDGSSQETIISSGINSPRGINVLESSGQMYWCEVTTFPEGKIQRTDVDGSTIIDTVIDLDTPQRIKIDDLGGKIYWCDEGTKKIQRSNFNGSFIETSHELSSGVIAIALDLGAQVETGSLNLFLKAPEPSTNDLNLFLKVPEPSENDLNLFLEADTTTIGDIDLYIQGPIPASGAIFLFLKEPEANNLNLRINGRDFPTQSQIFITAINDQANFRDKIFQLDTESSGLTQIVVASGDISPLPMGASQLPTFDGIKEIAISTSEGKIYWADDINITNDEDENFSGSIRSVNLDGQYAQNLITGPQSVLHPSGYTVNFPIGLALDDIGGKIYWTDIASNFGPEGGRLLRADLNGSNVEVLLDGFEHPSSDIFLPKGLTLDTINSKIYWINNNQIKRCNFDGSSPQVILAISNTATSITINASRNKIYWNLPTLGIIKRANTDGSAEENFIKNQDLPRGLLIDVRLDKLYWVEHDLGNIKKANADFLDGENANTRTDIETVATFNPVFPVAMAIQYPELSTTSVSGQMNLFMYGPQPSSGEITLFLSNLGIFNTWSLFLESEPIPATSGSLELYVLGSPSGISFSESKNSIDLFMKVIGDPSISPETFNTTLYLQVDDSDNQTNNNWTLFLKSQDVSLSATLGLFLEANIEANGAIDLFIFSDRYVNNWTLFLQGIPGTQNDLTLFIDGIPREPTPVSGDISLFIDGIFIPQETINLYIFGVSGISTGTISLYINPAPLPSDNDFKLYIHGGVCSCP